VDPQCMGMDGSGNLYITTAYGGGLLLSVPPPFFSGAYNVIATGGAPTALAVDPTDDLIAMAASNHVYEYDKSLNLIQTSGSFGQTPTLLAYGDGYFAAAVNAGTNASFEVFAASGFTTLGGYSFLGNVGSMTFDTQSNLLLATATGISSYSAPW